AGDLSRNRVGSNIIRRVTPQMQRRFTSRPAHASRGRFCQFAFGALRGLVPRAQILRSFMIASAASALRRGIKMRVCRYCNDWFELRRRDAAYCSGSCQAADYKQRAIAEGTTVLELARHRKKGRPHGERT